MHHNTKCEASSSTRTNCERLEILKSWCNTEVHVYCEVYVPKLWKLHAGNSGRLLEMLHGSDGLGKLVSELQQKEEEEVAHQLAIREGEAQEQQQQQQQPESRRKRGQAHRDSFHPKASEHKSVKYCRMETLAPFVLHDTHSLHAVDGCIQRGFIFCRQCRAKMQIVDVHTCMKVYSHGYSC